MDRPCVCGHSVEEHGGDEEYPGNTACGECDCIAYEADGPLDNEDQAMIDAAWERHKAAAPKPDQ